MLLRVAEGWLRDELERLGPEAEVAVVRASEGSPNPTELSREQIERALAAAGGDLGRAARSLEVSEHGLKKRLAELERDH